MFKNFLILILKSARYRPIRSWLTILGIIIGIMLVVIILSLGSGIQAAVKSALQMFGSDLILVMPGKETNPLLGMIGGQKFKEKDLINLEKFEGMEFILPMNYEMVNTEYKGEKKSTMLHAANWKNYIKVMELSQGIKLESGRWPQSDEAREVVLGHRAARDLFKQKAALYDEITIKTKRYKIVGTLSPVGEQMADNVIFVSMELFRNLSGSRQGASSAFVKVKPGVNADILSRQIKYELQKQETVQDFVLLTPDKADRLVGNVLAIIELVLVIIALISLLVGAVGIMNTMYTSVLERTKQIGIMKAIGASHDAVLILFLIESGLIGLIGGALGIFFGVISAYIIGIVAANFGVRGLFSFASLDLLGFLVIMIITSITGIVSGVLPARQAAGLEPAEALRYE